MSQNDRQEKNKQTLQDGSIISIQNGQLKVPDQPILPFIEGDGIGRDIWRAVQPLLDTAVELAYHGKRKIQWLEVLAGEKAFNETGEWLPKETLKAFNTYLVSIKGPLTTPVGGGIRSLNVAIRKELDLYVCLRPLKYYTGVPSPVKHPELVDMVVFRENTEDIYTGIEFKQGTEEHEKFSAMLEKEFPMEFAKIRFPQTANYSLKPVSKEGTERLVRAAIQWALDNNRKKVTLVHKGNIMKFTEGYFRSWGYELADREFRDKIFTQLQYQKIVKADGEEAGNQAWQAAEDAGKLIINDIIADIVFEQTITNPAGFDVLATMNLNGDYLSDGLSAQVGGVGIAPGGNINYDTGVSVFEATHGTAPKFADKDVVNPCSLLLSAVMLFQYMNWQEAGDLMIKGIEKTIQSGKVTFDFHHLMPGSTCVKTSEFGQAIADAMRE
ncbi:MAG: NADP-dependent isocitrate dehydrogenase [Anaerolineaceae bacterium]|nr:NADP-dependent isocitrate dehydrogenase [Anaerolineaceae bacterium]